MPGATGTQRWIAAGIALSVIYLYNLAGFGIFGADEPRYAAIGREMAFSGDFITPRLWGEPWFEKPALLYWMIAAGFRLGLGPETAPRVPVALAAIAFLIAFHRSLTRIFDAAAARAAATILATSAGWVAYGNVAVTDLPMSAAYTLAMLWGFEGRFLAAAVMLAVAVLGKTLVPLALLPPLAWFIWRRWRELLPAAAVFAAIAAPWYIACYARNGWPFIAELIVKQHFQRLYSPAIQHVQPAWFYAPVLAGLLFPWTFLAGRLDAADRRIRFFAAWAAWGLLLFSISLNKLPGYLLPILPACAVLLARTRITKLSAALTGLLLGCIPLAFRVLPAALASGITRASFTFTPTDAAGCAAAIIGCIVLRRHLIEIVGATMLAGILYAKIAIAPAIDATTARPRLGLETCQSLAAHRSLIYGINYYTHKALPLCPEPAEPAGEPNTPVVTRD